MSRFSQNRPEEYRFHKERLDRAFKFIKEENSKRNSLNRIDDTFLLSLNRHLERKGSLTTKQHIALEGFIEKWRME